MAGEDNIRFSVIIPLYNRGGRIRTTLQSVFEQAYKPLEIIICNDGSTDNSVEVIDQINSKLVRLISIENSGPSYARKVAVEHAAGNWLAFLDSDDIWSPGYLESLRLIIEATDAETIVTNFRLVEGGHVVAPSKFSQAPAGYFNDQHDKRLTYEPASSDLFVKAFRFQPSFPSALACSKHAYLRAGGITLYDRKLKSEDAHFVRKLYFFTTVFFNHRALVDIVIHPGNRSKKADGSTDLVEKIRGRLLILRMLSSMPEINKVYGLELSHEIDKSQIEFFEQLYWHNQFKEAVLEFRKCNMRRVNIKNWIRFFVSLIR